MTNPARVLMMHARFFAKFSGWEKELQIDVQNGRN